MIRLLLRLNLLLCGAVHSKAWRRRFMQSNLGSEPPRPSPFFSAVDGLPIPLDASVSAEGGVSVFCSATRGGPLVWSRTIGRDTCTLKCTSAMASEQHWMGRPAGPPRPALLPGQFCWCPFLRHLLLPLLCYCSALACLLLLSTGSRWGGFSTACGRCGAKIVPRGRAAAGREALPLTAPRELRACARGFPVAAGGASTRSNE